MAAYIFMAIIWLIIFMFGASVFSFLNVVIYRVPRGLEFVSGRSFCPKCHSYLAPWQMVPVFNYFYLRGKCHYCGDKISARYPSVEALGGGLMCLSVYLCVVHSEPSLENFARALVIFALFGILTVIAFVDAESLEIPNGFIISLFVAGAAAVVLFPNITLFERLIGIVCISVPMFLLTLVIEDAFGFGDIKLMAGSGFCLGWRLTLTAFVFGTILSGIYGVILLIFKKKNKKDKFAFAPFLCIGIFLSLIIGAPLLDWLFAVYRV